MIAAGCDAADHRNNASFLHRAEELLADVAVTVAWEAGDPVTREFANTDTDDGERYPRARYLSQKFVEELCSADGITDALFLEIERVIFEAHPLAERDGVLDFAELLDLRAARFRSQREREELAIAQISDEIGTEPDKARALADIKSQIAQKEKSIKAYETDRGRLMSKGSEARVTRLTALSAAAEKVRSYLRYFARQQAALGTLKMR